MALQAGRTQGGEARCGRSDEHASIVMGMPRRAAAAVRDPVQGLRIMGLAGAVGGLLVIGGSMLPWLEIDAGLKGLAGTRGVNGQTLLVGGAVAAALGIASVIASTDAPTVLAPEVLASGEGDTRGGGAGSDIAPSFALRARRLRFALGITGMVLLAFIAWLLPRLFASEAQLAATGMFMPTLGPGLFVALAGALLTSVTLIPSLGAPRPLNSSARHRSRMLPGVTVVARDPQRLAQLVLASLWLLDAALQFQPYMFSRGFAQALVAQDGQGATGGLVPVGLVAHLMVPHAAAANALFANVQLLIALGILWPRTVRPALLLSVLWAGGVWSIGEGFGGLLATGATPLTGAPGAALLYIGAVALAWPWRTRGGRLATWSQVRRVGDLLWTSWWLVGAALMVQPVLDAPNATRSVLLGAAAGMPGPIAVLDRMLAAAATGAGLPIALALLVVQAAVGFGALRPSTRTFSLALGSILALGLWVTTQSLGGIPTGMGTDPNSGLVLVALALLLAQPIAQATVNPLDERFQVSSWVTAQEEPRFGRSAWALPHVSGLRRLAGYKRSNSSIVPPT